LTSSREPRWRNPPVYRAERVARADGAMGESPVWDAATGWVTWVDIARSLLCRVRPGQGQVERFSLAQQISAIVPREGGGFLAAGAQGFWALDITGDSASLSDLHRCPALAAGGRMNDGACDRQGRFWAGSMAAAPAEGAPAGRLWQFAGGTVRGDGARRFRAQNGLAWSPDGRRMYMTDSHPRAPGLWVHEYDPHNGTIGTGQSFADAAELGGRPDGAAMDADGCYWIAASDGGRVLRLTPAGQIDAIIEIDVPNPTNICFFGSDLGQAFITTLRAGGTGPGGDVYAVALPFRGFPETPSPDLGT
jgi:sugar lactone lactonase YvrE